MVRVEEPLPVIVVGLNPPLETPLGNPFSLPTLRLTVEWNPARAWMVTVYIADWPGTTATDVGVTTMEKSGLADSAEIARVGGLGSVLP